MLNQLCSTFYIQNLNDPIHIYFREAQAALLVYLHKKYSEVLYPFNRTMKLKTVLEKVKRTLNRADTTIAWLKMSNKLNQTLAYNKSFVFNQVRPTCNVKKSTTKQ